MKGLPIKRFLLYGFPALLYAGFIISLSSLSGVPELYPDVFGLDRVLHPVSTTYRYLGFSMAPPGGLEDIVERTWTY